ncbi:MAG: hypothetical protein ABII23_03370 [bacterium]
MKIDKNYFIKQGFTKEELNNHIKSIKRDLTIAQKNKDPEVIFHFTYMALIKLGIYIIAKNGYRIKSRPGHHIIIIETLSTFLHSEDIASIGNNMRKYRNLDFYSSSIFITSSEVKEYFEFVSDLCNKVI